MASLRAHIAMALLVLEGASALTAQDQRYTEYLAGHYANPGKVGAATFLADARRDGLIKTTSDRLAAKHAFARATERRALPGLRGRRGNAFNFPPGASRATVPGPSPAAVIAESEWNDSPGWADDITGVGGATGSLSATDDRDFFVLRLASNSQVTLAVGPGSGAPVDDPDLEVFDANGFSVAYADDSVGLYPGLVLVLGAGTYYVAVGGPHAAVHGSYALYSSVGAATIPALVTGTLLNSTLGGTYDPTFRLVLANDAHVSATVSGPTGSDMFFVLRGSDGHSIKLCDDTSVGLDPALVTNLPAGTYWVSFGEWSNGFGAFSYRFTVTAATPPALSCSMPGSGNIVGDEDFDLFKFTNPATQRVVLQTMGGSPLPIRDTLLRLFDANLRLIACNDEASPSTSISLLDTPLPVGTYYVSVQGTYGDFGDYKVSAACAPPTATPVAWGKTAAALTAPGQARAYAFQVGTPGPLEVRVDSSSGTLVDPQVAIVDASGLCHGFCDDVFGALDAATGNVLPAGSYWVLVREWANGTGTFDLHVRPQLWFEDAVAKRTLVTHAKSGSNNYAFVALNVLPTGLPLPPPFVGSLLVDLSVHVQLGPIVCPAVGTFSWSPSLQPYAGICVQGISIGGIPAMGVLSDLVR